MKKKFKNIGMLACLAILFLFVSDAFTAWKYNPFTRKLDYYALDIGAGLVGEAAGDVLYHDGTNWTNLAIGAATEVLAVSGAGIPNWVAAGAPGAHQASHEIGGADLVDHDNLTNFVGNEHLLVGAIDHDSLLNYVFRQHIDIDNVFYVAAVGGEYATITAALNAENAAGNIFFIGPGTYAGDQIDFTANDQTVIGMGDINDVHVTQADGIVIDFGAFDGCSVRNVHVEVTAATTAAADVITGTGSLWLYDVYVQLTNLNVVLADQPACIDTTGIIRMHRGLIEYANGVDDGGGVTAIKAAIRIGAGADVLLDHVRFDVTGANQSLALTSSYATGGVLSFYKCYIDVDDDASSNTIGVVYSNVAGTHEMYMNDIHVDNATLLAHGVFLINTDTMRSMFNHIHVTSAGGSAYGLNAEAGTTIISQFDDIVATTPTNGAGTFTVVNSPEDGNFFVSGTVIIAGATVSVGDADTAGSVIVSDGSNHTQTISTGALDADITFVLPVDDGDNLDFLQTNGGGTLAWAAGAGDAFTVKVDAGAVAGYLGVAFDDGVLRTSNSIGWTDGGNFVTLDVTEANVDHGSLAGLADKDHLLNGIGNPDGNVQFNMTTRQVRFLFTNPATADGGFEIEASGAFSGDLVHIHQHTGNPGAVDLMHLEADDADVVPLRVTGAGTYDAIIGKLSVTGISNFTGTTTIDDMAGAAIGNDVQAYNAVLTELTALTDPAADKFPFWNNTTDNFEFSAVIHPIAGGVSVGTAGNAGKLELEDATGDVLGISVGIQAGNTDYVWPIAFPVTGQILSSTDAGVMTWVDNTSDAFTVKVDAGAVAGFLGVAAGDGVLRTSNSIGWTDGGNFVTLDVTEANVDHDSLSNFVTNEHINWEDTATVADNFGTSGFIAAHYNAEVRFYDNGNYVGFEAGALDANQIWVLPLVDGGAGQFLRTNGGGVLSFAAAAGGGTMTTAMHGGVGVGDADIIELDFLAQDFVIAEGADTHIDISLDYPNSQKATTAQAGFLTELATIAEVSAGVDTTRAVTADALAGSDMGRKSMIWKLTASDGVVPAGDDLDSMMVPDDFAGWLVVDVLARVITVDDAADDITIDIYNVTQTADILSTPMTIDGGEASTRTSAVAWVIDLGEDNITAADVIRIDITGYAGDNAAGLEVHITFERVT